MQKHLVQWTDRKTQILVFILLGLYLMLFLPFWKPVLLALLFASATAPIVNMVRDRLHARRSRVAYAGVVVGLAILIGFISLIALQVYSQLYDVLGNPETMSSLNEKITNGRESFLGWLESQRYLSSMNVRGQIDKSITGVANSLKSVGLVAAQGFVSNAPIILLNLFIFLAAFSVFLVSLPKFRYGLSHLAGVGPRAQEHFDRFEKICGLALGSVLIVGLVQSVMVTIGAAIAGYSAWLMVFAITIIFSLIPVLGAGLVPTLLALIGLVQGDITAAIILGITAVIVGVTDNLLRAWLFSRAAESNPVVSIITLLGGVALFGFIGLFVAPVLEQLAMTYVFSPQGEPQPHKITADDEHAEKKSSRPLRPRTI